MILALQVLHFHSMILLLQRYIPVLQGFSSLFLLAVTVVTVKSMFRSVTLVTANSNNRVETCQACQSVTLRKNEVLHFKSFVFTGLQGSVTFGTKNPYN